MSMYRFRLSTVVLLATLIAFAGSDAVFADSPSVTAVLSNSEAAIGETVQLQIKLSGARDAKPPEDISVDGLEIHATGTSRQFEMRNFTTTSSVTYNYTVLPMKPGTFKIPPQTVRVGGSSLQTPELTLRVSGTSQNPNAPNGAAANQEDSGKLAFAELIVPKKTAYVGE